MGYGTGGGKPSNPGNPGKPGNPSNPSNPSFFFGSQTFIIFLILILLLYGTPGFYSE